MAPGVMLMYCKTIKNFNASEKENEENHRNIIILILKNHYNTVKLYPKLELSQYNKQQLGTSGKARVCR